MSTITFSDVRNADARREFIENAPEPTECHPTQLEDDTPMSIDEIFTGMPLPEQETPIQQHPRQKRMYVKVTVSQKRLLTTLYAKHGDNLDAEHYSFKTGIRIGNARLLLTKLRKGEDIIPVVVRRGRCTKISSTDVETIIDTITEDNQVTIKHISKRIKQIHNKTISQSTISRFLAFPERYGHLIPKYVFKRCAERCPTANTPENKELRVKRVEEQHQAKREGRILTYVDETSINLASIRNYGWAPQGEKVFAYRKKRHLNLSAITYISEKGVEYCQFIMGNVDAATFHASMQYFLANCCEDRQPRAFVMDNAKIHDPHLKEYVEQFNHKLIFNAPNSPEMNPIELVFGMWKNRCADILNKETDKDAVRDKMAEVLRNIEVFEVKRCIEHVCSTVWMKIRNREDI